MSPVARNFSDGMDATMFNRFLEKFPHLGKDMSYYREFPDINTRRVVFEIGYLDGVKRHFYFTSDYDLTRQLTAAENDLQAIENNERPKGASYYHKRGEL